MLRRDASESVSFCEGFKRHYLLHVGGIFLPFLAVMLLATPQLAFAQDSLVVTVNPRSLDIDEPQGNDGDYTDGRDETQFYSVALASAPEEDVKITVRGAPHKDATTDSGNVRVFSGDGDETEGLLVLTITSTNWTAEGVMVNVEVREDADAVGEVVTLTHTATVGGDEVALRHVTVDVSITDTDKKGVTVNPRSLDIDEAMSGTYMVVLATEPTAPVTVDVGGASDEIVVSPSRLLFTDDDWDDAQTVTVFAGEDFDGEDDSATLTHTVRGGDYTGVPTTPERCR